MLAARLVAPAEAAPARKSAAGKGLDASSSSPASSSSSPPAASRRRRSSSDSASASLHLTLPTFLPADFPDRLLVGFFGTTVIGQLYTWPLAALLLYSAPKAARALSAAGRPLLSALVVALAAGLLLYLRFILGRGFREAEVTPNARPLDDNGRAASEELVKFWWQRAPLKRWRQWSRLRRFVGAQLVRVGPPLDPSRAYVFAGFPHGISAISAFANLVVDPPLPVAGEGDDEQDGDDGDDGAGEQEAQSKPAPAAAAAAADAAADAAPSPSPSPPPPLPAAADRHRGSFGRLFPGLSMHAMTLASNFKAPLVREYCLSLGLRPATRTSCAALLTERLPAVAPAASTAPPPSSAPPSSGPRRRHLATGHDDDDDKATTTTTAPSTTATPDSPSFRPAPGRAIFLAPGGAAEALLCRPGGCYDVLLARRKGFCRVALATGADVVPVLMFGETDLFDVWIPPAGSFAWKMQRLSHRLFGTSQPIFRGEGLLGADHKGLLPRRWSPGCGRPRLTTVVGQPVRVEGGPWRSAGEEAGGGSAPSWPPRIPKRGADPAFEAAVDALHARYCRALRALFDEHRRAYHPQGAELRVADGGGDEAGAAASSSRMQH